MCSFSLPDSLRWRGGGEMEQRETREEWVGTVSWRQRNWVCQPVCHSCSSCMSSSCPLHPPSHLYCTQRRLVRTASGSPAVYTAAASRRAGRSNQRPVSHVASRASPRPSGGSRAELCSLDHARGYGYAPTAEWQPVVGGPPAQSSHWSFFFFFFSLFFSKRAPRVPLRLAGSGRWCGRQRRGRASRAPSAARCRG